MLREHNSPDISKDATKMSAGTKFSTSTALFTSFEQARLDITFRPNIGRHTSAAISRQKMPLSPPPQPQATA
jgi:hypothetical protein